MEEDVLNTLESEEVEGNWRCGKASACWPSVVVMTATRPTRSKAVSPGLRKVA